MEPVTITIYDKQIKETYLVSNFFLYSNNLEENLKKRKNKFYERIILRKKMKSMGGG